jgi:hypothetical protein
MHGATARSAVIGQNEHRVDHSRVVLLCYPPHSPALLDKKIADPNIVIFLLREIQQETYLPALQKLVFLWVHLYDLLSIARVGFSSTPYPK